MTATSYAPLRAVSSHRSLAMGLLIRFVFVATVLAALSYRFGADLAEQLLPALKAEITWLQDTYPVKQLYVDRSGSAQVIRVVVGLSGCVVVEDKAFCGADPRAQANASTMVGNITMPAVLMLALLAAWPVRQRREYVLRLLIAPLALAVMWALDLPLFLWAAFWGMHVDAIAPGTFSPLLVWTAFLQNGGRLALPCVTMALTAGSAMLIANLT